jgi:3-phosphoshikimate 1-carboxyvinyltransferase
MSDYLLIPPVREVRGTIWAPPSKSATNRALILAALSPRPIDLGRPLDSDDTRVLGRCLASMGASIETTPEGIRLHGPLAGPQGAEVLLDAGESGTAARFLIALSAVTPGRFLVTGSRRLRERPMGPLAAALAELGAHVTFTSEAGLLPVAVEGRALASSSVNVDASASSQFMSALLLAGAALPDGLAVRASGAVASSPYVQMTVETLRAFGHAVETGAEIRVRPAAVLRQRYEIPGDYSSAVPILAAAGVAGGEVCVEGLRWPSLDADALAVEVLEGMGLEISKDGDRIRARRRGEVRPITVRAADFPDAVPALVALSAFASGASRFEGIAHLRLKESDRIGALVELLGAAGVSARAEQDAICVEGPVSPGESERLRRLPTRGDHRIAMAGALLSLALPGLAVENPGCVAKSYPAFFGDLERLAIR